MCGQIKCNIYLLQIFRVKSAILLYATYLTHFLLFLFFLSLRKIVCMYLSFNFIPWTSLKWYTLFLLMYCRSWKAFSVKDQIVNIFSFLRQSATHSLFEVWSTLQYVDTILGLQAVQKQTASWIWFMGQSVLTLISLFTPNIITRTPSLSKSKINPNPCPSSG